MSDQPKSNYSRPLGTISRLFLITLIAQWLISVPVAGAQTSCSVAFGVTDALEIGALQYDVDYAAAAGEFDGMGPDVSCRNESTADLFSFNDRDSSRVLLMGYISLSGFRGPQRMASCDFTAIGENPTERSFVITVADAADLQANAIDVDVSVESITCAGGCGDPTGDGAVTAGDALVILQGATGLADCPLGVCDVNSDGAVTVADALRTLRYAVVGDEPLDCGGAPPPVTTTTLRATQELTIANLGNGAGRVTSLPAGIDCGADCTNFFFDGIRVTVSASPNAGSTFVGWGGDIPAACANSTEPCAFRMGRTRNITATFELSAPIRTLDVNKQGTGTGRVASSPAGINCGADCQHTYPDGTRVTLAATADAGSTFTGWTGDIPNACVGVTSSCSVRMGRDRQVVAAFDRDAPTCPTSSPLTDLRTNCSDIVYVYASSVEGAGFITDGVDIDIAIVSRSTGEGAAILGDVSGARSFTYNRVCLLDRFGNVTVCGAISGDGGISSTGRTLTINLEGRAFNYSFVGTSARTGSASTIATSVVEALRDREGTEPSAVDRGAVELLRRLKAGLAEE